MRALAALTFVLLAVLSVRGVRVAYVLFVVLALAYFPAKVGFELEPRTCQLDVDAQLAVFSLTNYAHIVLFALFFLMSYAQVNESGHSRRSAVMLAGLATFLMGALVEVAQGATGAGNCRLRDLIPDSVGIVVAALGVTLWLSTRHRVRAAASRFRL